MAPFAVDSDGTGPSHGDTCQQKETSLKPNLNADEENYVVLPPRIMWAVGPIVLGCQAFIRNPRTGQFARAVVGDASNDAPTRKMGEGSVALAREMGIDPSPVSGGSDDLFEWTFIPGVAAVVAGKKYALQAL